MAFLERVLALKGFDCALCRTQFAEVEREVPCDVGGIAACPIVPSPGATPLPPEAARAWEFFVMVDEFGLELTNTLLHWDLTPSEAEEFVWAYAQIHRTIAAARQQEASRG